MPILVVDADKEQSRELCDALDRENYHAIALHTLLSLEERIKETACRVVILDLDTMFVDNRFILKLRSKNPRLPIIGLSGRPFHPELEKAISTHICACISKPPDIEEIIYCIKSFCENGVNTRGEQEGGSFGDE